MALELGNWGDFTPINGVTLYTLNFNMEAKNNHPEREILLETIIFRFHVSSFFGGRWILKFMNHAQSPPKQSASIFTLQVEFGSPIQDAIEANKGLFPTKNRVILVVTIASSVGGVSIGFNP